MTTKILFLCPHNAAKSVAAAAYLSRQAEKKGLQVEVSTAGTDPDGEVLPVVRARLEREGHIIDSTPRRVDESDLADADRIVNIGCDAAELPTTKPTDDWTVPNFSDDPEAAFASLRNHAVALVEELAEISG